MPDSKLVTQLQQAHALFAQGKAEQAIVSVRRLALKHATDPGVSRLLAQMLLATGQAEQARFALSRALGTHAGNPDLHALSAEIESFAGRHDDATAAADRALALEPAHGRAHAVKGLLLLSADKPADSIAHLRHATEAFPAEPEHRSNLALAQLAIGNAAEASDLLASVARDQPGFTPALGAYAQTLNYDPRATPGSIFDAHAAYGRAAEAQHKPRTFPNHDRNGPLDGARPLRVGFLSRDLRRHSCAYFLLPILEHLDRGRVEPVAYHDSGADDDMTARFRSGFPEWRDTAALTNEALAAQIGEDRIDVLIDLGSHFFGARLDTFALRPAPTSVSYLAYPNTTGLARLDARIVDANTDPASDARTATETLVRLGRPMWCYRPDDDAPAPVTWPDGPVTLASFNDLKKTNDPLLDDWAEILNRAPDARLLIKTGALSDDGVRASLGARLESRGVAPDRFDLLGTIPSHAEHLALYGRVHLALDTFPYHGTTTTCEAAWMGVPTLTRVGDRHASRVGLSINGALGLTPDLTPERREGYVNTAVALATDEERLRVARARLRDRFVASALRDEAGFTRDFTEAIFGVYRAWAESGRD